MGLDSTDSDKFKIGDGYEVGGASSTFVTIDTAGNLGIGEDPKSKLHVTQSGSAGTVSDTVGSGFTLMHTAGAAAGVQSLALRNTGTGTHSLTGSSYASQIITNSTNANALEIYTQGTIRSLRPNQI